MVDRRPRGAATVTAGAVRLGSGRTTSNAGDGRGRCVGRMDAELGDHDDPLCLWRVVASWDVVLSAFQETVFPA